MIHATLPGIFRPLASTELVRLGRNHDGGYLVDSRDISAADCLISLGVNDDWSFERSFRQLRSVPVEAYDGSIGARDFFQSMLKCARRPRRPRDFLKSVRVLADYVWFFTGSRKHYRLFVGTEDLQPNISLANVFEKASGQGLVQPFLKIDIEGSEYAILDELVARASCSTGLVIEFHDCDIHRAEIQAFIERYPLRLVHVHANNYAPLSQDGFPKVLELTFSSSDQSGIKPTLPHPLDMPNDRRTSEIALSFPFAPA